MRDFSNMLDQKFPFAIFGINKQAVYSYLREAESAYNDLVKKVAELEEKNESVAKLNQDTQLKFYNLQKEIDESKEQLRKANNRIRDLEHDLMVASGKKVSTVMKEEPASIYPEDEEDEKIATIAVEEAPAETTEEVAEETETTEEAPVETAEDTVEETSEEVTEDVVEETPVEPAEAAPVEVAEEETPAETTEEVVEEAPVEEPKKEPFSFAFEDDDEDEVFVGDVEDNVKVGNAFRIGNDDDPDEGFDFL